MTEKLRAIDAALELIDKLRAYYPDPNADYAERRLVEEAARNLSELRARIVARGH